MVLHTDTDRSHALAALELAGGNVSKVSRDTGIPRSTITLWRGQAIEAGQVAAATVTTKPTDWNEIRKEAGSKFLEIASEAADIVLESLKYFKGRELSAGDLQRIATILGINSDKAYDWLVGRRNSEFNINVDARQQNVLAGLTTEQLIALTDSPALSPNGHEADRSA